MLTKALDQRRSKARLKDAEDSRAFEAAITADYDAPSAAERELVLRLASLLWRLRRATTMETGLFEIQADHLSQISDERHVDPESRHSCLMTVHLLFTMILQPRPEHCIISMRAEHWGPAKKG
jgi:hypothetical protein